MSDSASTGSAAAANQQTEPMMDMHDASIDDKLAGIVAQTRQDVADGDHERVEEVLRQRLRDTGIDVTDEQRTALVHEVRGTTPESS
ncbi:hypothetical protein [Microbacterium sp. P02]|uniref:hypothetical protein n=1 Tax=Microbacterium sp. P02 TaxID=3366260 RepID=UPI003671C49A